MIDAMSQWTKSLGLAIIIISILEMILPNNKIKKYIKVVMGMYILFTIISPFINDKQSFAIADLDFEQYVETSTNEINQTSMDNRIKQLYVEEMESNIKTKIEEKGYIVNSCKVNANIPEQIQDTTINKITIKVEKNENANTQNNQNNNSEDTIENKVVTSIQSIKNVNISSNEGKEETTNKLSKSEIKELKQFLINEYGVSEECLEIN